MPIQLSGSLVITGSITTTGVITMSGSIASATSASYSSTSDLLQGTGSVGFTTTGSFTTMSGSVSSRVSQIETVYATTGSNSFRATQSITGSLTVTGQIIAQTLNVQQVTSSIVYSSGSNVFGCDLNSRQTFTGSVLITGSLNTVGNACITSVCSPTIIGGTVSGTTGTFSSTIQNVSGIYVRASGNSDLPFINFSNADGVYNWGRVGGLLQGDGDGALYFQTKLGGGLTEKLRITSAGIACFANTVCAPQLISTGTVYAGPTSRIGFGTPGAERGVIALNAAYDWSINTNSIACAMFICSANGNVGIGTTDVSYKLRVEGTLYSLNAARFNGVVFSDCRLMVGVAGNDQTYANIFVGGALTSGTTQYALLLDPQLSGTTNYGILANARIKASTATTNAYGVFILNNELLSGASIVNNYGLYIANQTNGSSVNYALYSAGGLNYFGGCVGIGINSPQGLLDVYKSASGGLGGHIILRNNGAAVGNEMAVMFVDGDVGTTRAAISSTTENSPYFGDIKFKTGLGTYACLNTRMTITGAGNVGIGFSTVSSKLQVAGEITSYAGTNTSYYSYMNYLGTTYNFGPGETSDNVDFKICGGATFATGGNFRWFTQAGNGTPVERMRIIPGGQTQFIHSTSDLDILYARNGSASPYGMNITFTAASPNNGSNNFLYLADSTTLRFAARSNGGLSNFSGNNINLASDIRLKKDISPLSSEWDKLKQIEVVNFKYKDSTDETALYGAIAQQVQEIYPNLVIVTREATEIEPEYYGLREQPFQWLTTKVLQEAMAKIEEQQCIINTLKTCIGIA